MFKGKQCDRSVILFCVRWYLAYNLGLRNLEERMAERGISADHATVGCWVVRYSSELLEQSNRRKRPVSRKWHVDKILKFAGDGCISTEPSTAMATRSSSDSANNATWGRRTLLNQTLKRHGRPERIASIAARPIGKPSYRVMPRADCRTNQDAG